MGIYLTVLVEFLSPNKGGRKNPINLNGSSYRPHFRVTGDLEYLGVQFVEGPEREIKPEELVVAKVKLIYYPNVSYDKLINGKEFEILEGAMVVGKGTVVNKELFDQ